MKIFPKTFVSSLSLIIGIIVIAFLLISVLLPRFYKNYKQDALNRDLDSLVSSLNNKDTCEMTEALEQFAVSHEYSITLLDKYGEILFSRAIGVSMARVQTGRAEFSGESMTITTRLIDGSQTLNDSAGNTLTLNLSSSMQPIDEASTVLLGVLPYVLLISLGLAAAVSFIYAKTITAPVKAISKAAINMITLEKDAKCDVETSDEIGELAGNINRLYGRLLTTINNLQSEMQNAAAADKDKIDFMLTVSHELKTPLTAVKGMLEGMIYNIGVYKDRDEYLARCGENIDALTGLVNEILDASKLELTPLPEDYSNVNIRMLVNDTAAAYEMIALSKQITINIDIAGGQSSFLPAGLFSKALSNIISNAVKHTGVGGVVNIYTVTDGHSSSLRIENTCIPLAPEEIRRVFEPFCRGEFRLPADESGGGHGLGLYLTERILKVCGLEYEFAPFDMGMRFVIWIG